MVFCMSIRESKAEKGLGIFFFVLGVLLITLIIPWQIAKVQTDWYNSPRFFPYAVSGLMVVLGALLFVSGVRKKKLEDQEIYSFTKKGVLSVVVTLGVIAIYVVLLSFLPYIPCTIAALGAMMWFFGLRDLRKLIPIAVLLPLLIYFGFTELLKLKLP